MYLRLVHFRIKPTTWAQLRHHYDERVIPTLQTIEGCQYACLTQSIQHLDEGLSMTLWESPTHADAYERSGTYQELVREATPFFAESSEWRVQLSDELQVEYEPVPEEPTVQAYTVAAPLDAEIPGPEQSKAMALRVLSVHIQPGTMDEFRHLYLTEILPALRAVKGCRYAYLTENLEAGHQVISLTIWESQEDAERYERSGLFEILLSKVQHTFSELYQWKLGLAHTFGGQLRTSEDLAVASYTIVTGRRFKAAQD